MAETNPAAATGGNNQQVDVAAIQKAVNEALGAAIETALKPVNEALTTLGQNQKVLGDTLAKLPPAPAAEAGKDGKDGKGEAAKPLAAEDVAKIVTDTIAKDRQAQQTTAEQRAARDAFLADPKNGLVRLPDAYKAQLSSDPAKWGDEAKSIAASWEKFAKDNKIALPDVGGAARDGGAAPAQAATTANLANSGALPDGLAKYAAEMDQQLSSINAANQARMPAPKVA
jgi:hypothetical protein